MDFAVALAHVLSMWAEYVLVAMVSLVPRVENGTENNWPELNRRAQELTGLGRYAEAEGIFRVALREAERLPVNHPHRLTALNNLASICLRLGNYQEAERLTRRLVLRMERDLGPRHPILARPLYNFATLLLWIDKPGMARERLRQAMDCVAGDSTGGSTQLIRRIQMGLATSFLVEGRLREAEAGLRQVIVDWHDSGQAKDSQYMSLLNNLGILLIRVKRTGEAAEVLEQAVETGERVLPPGHPEMVNPLSNLADAYHGALRMREAEALVKRAIVSSERSGDYWSRQYGLLLMQHADLLRHLKRKGEAKGLEERGRQIFARAEGEMPGRHTVDLSELAAVPRGQ